MSKLETTTTRSGGRATVVLAGELDISTTDQALEALAEAKAEASDLVIDLRKLDFVDSSGLSVIAQTAQQVAETGLTLRVIPSEQVRRLLEITGIASHLDLGDHNA